MNIQIADIFRSWLDVFEPPPRMTVSEWSDEYRFLSPESSGQHGKYSTAMTPYAREWMDSINDLDSTGTVLMVGAQLGKALAVSTPIATPKGWTTMGGIIPGDTIYGSDGQEISVLGVSPIMEERKCFEVVFSDKSRVVADEEHLWTVDDDLKGVRTITTGEIRKTYKFGKNRNRYAIPVAPAIDCSEKALPIDPYVLGAWLGDGHSYSSRVYGHRDDIGEMANQIEAAGHRVRSYQEGKCWVVRIDEKRPEVCPRGHDKNATGWSARGCAECSRVRSKNYLRRKRGQKEDSLPPIIQTLPRLLLSMGLLENKHIPEAYLRGSKLQRIHLLQGLMDTDGSITKEGRPEFVTTSDKIAEGFGELLHSLGIKHTVKETQPQTTYKGKRVYGAPGYKFSFMVYDDTPIFRLKRKKERLASTAGRRVSETTRRRIVDVIPVESVPVRCILVDSADHLFLAGRALIPTHNTEVLNNMIGYFIDVEPSPMLMVQPTIELGEAWSKERLAPMARDTPRIRDKIADVKSRTSGNTILHKSFPGGNLAIAGANAPSGLASRPRRVVLLDEVDRYPVTAGSEGDPSSLAIRRTETFWNAVIVMTSTPTVKGRSRIETEFESSDQRRYFCNCPRCGFSQTLKWVNVKWEAEDGSDAWLQCEGCKEHLSDEERVEMVHAGKWVPTYPERSLRGYHLPGIASMFRHKKGFKSRLHQMAWENIKAKKAGKETLRTWINTFLAETWEDEGESVPWEPLMARREDWGTFPEGALILTAGVDIQGDRFEVEIVGWGDGEESWSIEHHSVMGDFNSPDTQESLDEILQKKFIHPSGTEIGISCTFIDSGHKTKAVYAFTKPREARRVYSCKGVGGPGVPLVNRPTRRGVERAALFAVGTDTAKELVYSRLSLGGKGSGFMHFPHDRPEDWFRQLTSETKVIRYRNGVPFARFENPSKSRNEALDIRVYASAALSLLRVNWEKLTKTINAPKPTEEDKEKAKAKKKNRRRAGWVGDW